MSVAVFGLSGDMPHFGHSDVVTFLAEKFDTVLVVPCGTRPDKPRLSPGSQRLKLVECMIEDIPHELRDKIILDSHEVNGPALHSFDLMEEIKGCCQFENIYFSVGADLVQPRADFNGGCQITEKWYKGKQLYDQNKFVVVPRIGYTHPDEFGLSKDKFIILEQTPREGASNHIRNLILSQQKWDHLVPPSVAECIISNRWYGYQEK